MIREKGKSVWNMPQEIFDFIWIIDNIHAEVEYFKLPAVNEQTDILQT